MSVHSTFLQFTQCKSDFLAICSGGYLCMNKLYALIAVLHLSICEDWILHNVRTYLFEIIIQSGTVMAARTPAEIHIICKQLLYSIQMYQRVSQGNVTYARGCKSPSTDLTTDTCDEYNEESCSTVHGTTVSTSYPQRWNIDMYRLF